MRIFFIAVGIVTAVVGILSLTMPAMMLGAWGIENPDEIALYMTQRVGALTLGICVIFSLAARTTTSAFRTALLSGGAFTFGIIFIVSAVGFFSSVVSSSVWIAATIELIIAISFLYFLFARSKSA